MSEQKQSFMQQLDAWTDQAIIEPLTKDLGGIVGVEMQLQIRRAVRQKVLESYRNGQAAGPAKPQVGTGSIRKERGHLRAKAR